MTAYLLAGGGTAGHVNPMLALADALRQRDATCDIVIVGTAEGLESRLVPNAGYRLDVIPKLPFPRRLNRAALAFPAGWRRTVRQLRELMTKRGIDVVIGVGGYAAAPAYAAARALRIPIVVHEANARPGLANRLGARWTRFVGVAIAGTQLRHARLVGMPLRPEFEHEVTAKDRAQARRSLGLKPTKPTLVVTGGSLGAKTLNRAVLGSANALLSSGVQILHITGKQPERIRPVAPGHTVLEYCDQMRDALASADLVVSRAGASTVCEIAALGIPAVFVPYPVGNGEQRFNAQPLVDLGAADMVPDAQFDAQFVIERIMPLITNSERLERMAELARAAGIRDGCARMLDLIDEARRESARRQR